MSGVITIVVNLFRIALNVLFPPLSGRWWSRTLVLVFFFLGALAGLAFLPKPDALRNYWLASLLVGAGLFTGACGVACMDRPGLGWRIARGVARAAVLPCYAAAVYLALFFGSLLAWAMPWVIKVLMASTGLLALVSACPRRSIIRVPALLPLSLWMFACLVNWSEEDHNSALRFGVNTLDCAARPYVSRKTAF